MVAVDSRVAKAVFGLTSYMTEKMRHVKTSEYLLTRCPVGTEARLRGSGACFCGTETMGAQVSSLPYVKCGEMLNWRNWVELSRSEGKGRWNGLYLRGGSTWIQATTDLWNRCVPINFRREIQN